MYILYRHPLTKELLGALRLTDNITIMKNSPEWADFVAWNDACTEPFDLNDGLPTFEERKAARIAKLEEETLKLVDIHYAEHRQRTLTYLMIEAGTNRKAYIREVWTWITSVFTYYYSKEDEINAAADDASLDAISWNFSDLTASDPQHTIKGALEILD